MDKEKAKQEVKHLVEKYGKVAEEKRIGKYNEEMTKRTLSYHFSEHWVGTLRILSKFPQKKKYPENEWIMVSGLTVSPNSSLKQRH